jgi:TolB-like protein/DNA-binding winged helix-turn-helix (wHTH) protein/Flp pilus assembly protein TadD
MVMTSDSRETFRFGDFVLDRGAYELRKRGRAVRLERQPMDLLILLVERRGQLVTRAEIVERLWGPDVFVDVETGVHTAIRKVRRALGESPDAPAFLETVPGRGYRFIAPVGVEGPGTLTAVPASVQARPGVSAPEAVPSKSPTSNRVRFATVALVLSVLAGLSAWAWHRTDVPPSDVTLAVLPFDNLSGDPEAEYLASGLAEEVMVALGQIDPARVHIVGRTSIMSYKHTTKSRPEIARELSADYLVESAVRAERGRVRITASLVRARDQVQVWSDSYDREPTSILSLQQELSEAIATQVRLRLSPDRLSALARRQTRNAEAYDLYLRGRNSANQRTPETTTHAIDLFKRATTLDPSYALAWAGLAKVYSATPLNADAPPLTVGPLAWDAATRAARTDPQLGEAQEALGHSLWTYSWDWPAAERALRRAVALDPQSVMGHVSLGHLLSQMGQHLEAGREMRRARELDPLFAMSHAISSQVAYQAHDYQSAVEYARQAITIDPDFWVGHIMLGQAYEGLGRTAEALEELATAARFSGQNSKALSFRGYLLAKAGRADEARDLLRKLEATSHQRYVPPYAFALVHAGLGDRDAVFKWLNEAFDAHDVHLIYLPADPKWDRYRDDPRFKAQVDRCNFMHVAAQ